MKSGVLNDSMTTPPSTSMFVHAGGTTPKKATSSNDPMSHAICQLASALTSNKPATTVACRVGDLSKQVEVLQRAGRIEEFNGIRSAVRRRIHCKQSWIHYTN